MARKRHKSDTKSFDELTFAVGSRSINATIANLERAIQALLNRDIDLARMVVGTGLMPRPRTRDLAWNKLALARIEALTALLGAARAALFDPKLLGEETEAVPARDEPQAISRRDLLRGGRPSGPCSQCCVCQTD